MSWRMAQAFLSPIYDSTKGCPPTNCRSSLCPTRIWFISKRTHMSTYIQTSSWCRSYFPTFLRVVHCSYILWILSFAEDISDSQGICNARSARALPQQRGTVHTFMTQTCSTMHPCSHSNTTYITYHSFKQTNEAYRMSWNERKCRSYEAELKWNLIHHPVCMPVRDSPQKYVCCYVHTHT